MRLHGRVDIRKGRLSEDVVAGDTVDAGIEGREVVARIDERLIFEDLRPSRNPTMPI